MKSFAELSNLPRASAFLNLWTEAFADVLEKVTGRKHPAELLAVESIEPDALSGAEKGFCATFSSGGMLLGEQACLVSESDAKVLAQLLMGEAPDSTAPLSDADRDAASEVFRQVAGQVATGLAAKWQGSVTLSFGAVGPVAWTPEAKVGIRIAVAPDKKLHVIVALQENLTAALAETADVVGPSVASSERAKAEAPAVAKDGTNANLDLLLEIELEATIRFGQREMLLRDVLDLRSGSVIELERHVEEPAELLVAGRPVARGEVVVVEGNYGLRITEILSPRQRYDVVGK